MVHAVAARGRLACCTCGAGGAGVPMSVERSGSLRPRRAAPLPLQIYHGKIKSKTSEPFLVSRNPRVEFVGSTTGKDNNISIVLKDVELSDAGKYTCHVKNPKEKNAQHNATIILTVVHRSKCRPGSCSSKWRGREAEVPPGLLVMVGCRVLGGQRCWDPPTPS